MLEAALAEDVSGVPGVVADRAARLADGVAHGLRVGAAPLAPHPRRWVSQAVAPVASSERVCRSLYAMAVSRTGRPATVTRCVARPTANRYAAGEDFPMTASPKPECLRKPGPARQGTFRGRESGSARDETG